MWRASGKNAQGGKRPLSERYQEERCGGGEGKHAPHEARCGAWEVVKAPPGVLAIARPAHGGAHAAPGVQPIRRGSRSGDAGRARGEIVHEADRVVRGAAPHRHAPRVRRAAAVVVAPLARKGNRRVGNRNISGRGDRQYHRGAHVARQVARARRNGRVPSPLPDQRLRRYAGGDRLQLAGKGRWGDGASQRKQQQRWEKRGLHSAYRSRLLVKTR